VDGIRAKGHKIRFSGSFSWKKDDLKQKGEEKIRKGLIKMIHWEPTEEEPKGEAEVGKRAWKMARYLTV
jgi:hypothetical protein